MKSPKKYLDNYRLIGMRELLSNMIKEVQKESYNQAIQDSVKSLQNYEMIWGNGAIVPSNQFEREILKLKIK